MPKPKKEKTLGQYFTISTVLQDSVYQYVQHKGACLLEPSFGAGHLLKRFLDENPAYPMVCCEIDSTIQPIVEFCAEQTVIRGDFMAQHIARKFKTIIANPPYVKQKTGNLYIQFIERCYSLLEEDGEMIFIVPSDFLKLTRASSILQMMTEHGHFTHFTFPHNERLFEEANIDVVVFRYEKGAKGGTSIVNGKEMVCNVSNGIITFSDTKATGQCLETLFHVYVGLVSGRDEVYRVPFGNIDLLLDKDKIEPFIFLTEFPGEKESINTHLLANKSELLSRKIKAFSEKNWFEWGAPRNLVSIRKHWGRPCVYVRTMTRNKEVAFSGTVQYFGGTLLCLVPKENVGADVLIQKTVEALNTAEFQREYMYAGRFKIGHKQICNVRLGLH